MLSAHGQEGGRPPAANRTESRCLHCGGTGFEGDDPCEFCDATGRDAQDARAGMAWFNSMTPAERAHWLEVAGSAVPFDAWRAFQADGLQP
ncbi:MAG: hypothetical protein WBE91_01170 [Steroidobacteraceae bacterium]